MVLVPPAPSTLPYPLTNTPSNNIKLNAKAVIKNSKKDLVKSSDLAKSTDTAPKPPATKTIKSVDNDTKSGVDSDFMLDWGSVKK